MQAGLKNQNHKKKIQKKCLTRLLPKYQLKRGGDLG
jgi:hypothetical protein